VRLFGFVIRIYHCLLYDPFKTNKEIDKETNSHKHACKYSERKMLSFKILNSAVRGAPTALLRHNTQGTVRFKDTRIGNKNYL